LRKTTFSTFQKGGAKTTFSTFQKGGAKTTFEKGCAKTNNLFLSSKVEDLAQPFSKVDFFSQDNI
jgi:hypothetical protein